MSTIRSIPVIVRFMLLNVNECPGTKFAATLACSTASVAGSSSTCKRVEAGAAIETVGVSAGSADQLRPGGEEPIVPGATGQPVAAEPMIRASLPLPPSAFVARIAGKHVRSSAARKSIIAGAPGD